MKEFDIRPSDLFNRYLQLCEKDVQVLFSDTSAFAEIPCPACNSSQSECALTKLGMRYVLCQDCGSLYVSPRPSEELIEKYYRESEGIKFWVREFYRETESARRKALFEPRAQLVVKLQQQHAPSAAGAFVDVGCGYGMQLEEIKKTDHFTRILGIEPGPALAEVCRVKGFDVIEKSMEEIGFAEIQASFVTAFEVLEHVYDPATFLKAVTRILEPGGLLLLTTLTVSGFDIQVLWEHSKAVHPPAHINLLSVTGLEKLFHRVGLEIIELTTPGKLDVDIVRNTAQENPDIILPRFVRHMVLDESDEVRNAFQQFLQAHRLSSHVRIIARPYNTKDPEGIT